MYRLFVAHCNAYTDEAPAWKISGERFESTLALYGRDQDAFDRGLRGLKHPPARLAKGERSRFHSLASDGD